MAHFVCRSFMICIFFLDFSYSSISLVGTAFIDSVHTGTVPLRMNCYTLFRCILHQKYQHSDRRYSLCAFYSCCLTPVVLRSERISKSLYSGRMNIQHACYTLLHSYSMTRPLDCRHHQCKIRTDKSHPFDKRCQFPTVERTSHLGNNLLSCSCHRLCTSDRSPTQKLEVVGTDLHRLALISPHSSIWCGE